MTEAYCEPDRRHQSSRQLIAAAVAKQEKRKHSMALQRPSPAPPRLVILVSCCLLAAAWGATQAQAAAPWHVAYDLRMNDTAPPMMLTAQNQTLLGVLMDILKDPYGSGAPSVLRL